jgi:SAM-dependent methyltransferase
MNEEQAQRWNGESGRRWIAQRERHAAVRAPLLAHLWRAAAIAPGDRVLDIGCGLGESSLAAAQVAGSVLGVDISETLLEVARGSAVSNVAFVVGDAQVYPFAPGSFDVVVSSFGVMFFDDPVAAFGNLYAALRPGGRLAFLCWQNDRCNELFGIPQRSFVVHDVPVPQDDDLFADSHRIAGLLATAGFGAIEVTAVEGSAWLGRDVADVMEYAAATPAVRRLSEGLDKALVDKVFATMEAEYSARLRDDGVWIKVAAWLASARRAGEV